MKNYYFLSGLPRAGNTVLGSLLNEDPQINLTANSVLPDVLYGIHRAKQREIYLNFPDQKFSKIERNLKFTSSLQVCTLCQNLVIHILRL